MKRLAYRHLDGVGDESRQWEDYTGYAFHLRRRLTAEEQRPVGAALDLRGTESAARRYAAAKDVLPAPALQLAMQEIGGA